MDKQWNVILGMGLVACTAALFPVAGHSATKISEGSQGEASVVLKQGVEAGKAVSQRALSSKAKKINAETDPVAIVTSSIVGKAAATTPSGSSQKYVFEYPDQPMIDEKMEPVKKKIDGEVGVVIKMGMNVEFDRNNKAASSSDLWINFTKGVKLEGVKAFGDFRDGDKVQVFYTESKDGSKRAIDSIKLLKAKTDEERKKESLVAEAAALAEAKTEKSVSLEDES